MTPNFALSLSFDGLRLMHRIEGGWQSVGQVALDDADLSGALARLKTAAEGLDPAPMATKLLIPNDQIKYLALDTTRAEEDDVRAALHGATPYAVDELVYDFSKGGGRTYIAAVARETLDEARAFADEHGFNPVSFAAVPEPFTYVGEAFFGSVDGHTAERDSDAVVVIGEANVDIPLAEEPVDNVVANEDPVEGPGADAALPDPQPDPTPEPEPQEDPVSDPAPTVEPDPETNDSTETDLSVEAAEDPQSEDAPTSEDTTADQTDDGSGDEEAAAPMFASRLRADRDEGRPAPRPADSERVEPTFGRRAPPGLAVPTGHGTDPMPPVAAPSRDTDGGPTAATYLSTEAPEPQQAPAITGDAPTALSPEAAVSSASLMIEPDDEPGGQDNAPANGSGDKGTVAAVGGAVGGMFASRRMARAERKAQQQPSETEPTDERARLTVFGARKPTKKPKQVVGGKPRFLGLILTAILLLFLLAIAAFAALSDETLARWFGWGNQDTQIAAAEPTAEPAPEPLVETPAPEAPEVVAVPDDALANPTEAAVGQVLTPEEAQRIYAATGVWQRAPRIPLTPRTTTLDALDLAVLPRPVVRVPSSPLADASSVAGDAVIATPVDPPPPTAVFDFGEDGLVVATPEGTPTPDGVLVIAGSPPLNPPTRPGTVAPEITPQDQLANLVPDNVEPSADAPDGVIVISGRPVIEPPIRPGTTPPAPALQDQVLADGDAPLLATDGLIVLAGAPPVLPPARPGTVAPSAQPDALQSTEPIDPTPPANPDPETATAPAAEPALDDIQQPVGVNLIAGPPPVLPPARPGTTAPAQDTELNALRDDLASALSTGAAQAPGPGDLRPLTRPATVQQAALALQNEPVLGGLTRREAAAFRPLVRPAGLAPVPQTPAPEPEPEPEATDAGLQIAPEIAAAVAAAANRPDPFASATALAVPVSARPDPRPRNMARIVSRAQEAQQRAATQAAAVAPRTVAPTGPTTGTVAQTATLENAINLRDVNLIGIYGGSGDRRALVRLANGRYLRVTVGDRLDGGRVTAITAEALSYTRRGRAITLEVPG